jgi:hypothetical protein
VSTLKQVLTSGGHQEEASVAVYWTVAMCIVVIFHLRDTSDRNM